MPYLSWTRINDRMRGKSGTAKPSNASSSAARPKLSLIDSANGPDTEPRDLQPDTIHPYKFTAPAPLTAPAIIDEASNTKSTAVVRSSSIGQIIAAQGDEDLWEKALQTLNDTEDTRQFKLTRTDRVTILKDVLDAVEAKKQSCMQKRWKYTKSNGEVVILRDVFEKIVTWVNKFKAVGDVAVQWDSLHASLPWAGIRFLLQAVANESQTFGAMAEAVEFVSNLITRCSIIEQLYLQGVSAAKQQLTQAIIKLYATLLKYILKARRFYDQNTAERMAWSLVQTAEMGVERYLGEISEAQANVDACMRLVEAEDSKEMRRGVQSVQRGVSTMEEETRKKLASILNDLGKPIIRMATQLSDLYDSLQKSERERIFEWMSSVPYMNHHRAKVKDCLPGSGHWLFENERFMEWMKSSVSSILWLRGIPGSGKSILISSVINHLHSESSRDKQPAPIAYFYCARNAAEPERANPDEILRCILEQLSSSSADLPIRESVVEAYRDKNKEAKGRAPEKLSLSESVELILTLLETNPAIIVIDALDECDPARRPELIKALERIIRESANLVKVFASSRDDGDIVCHLAQCPNVFIEASNNRVDIERFVRTGVTQAIKEKRLINGDVPKRLEDRIIETLIGGAQGMFRWVSLQIQNLCDSQRIKFEEDIEEELTRLPKTLVESYDIIYQTISNSGGRSRAIAEKTMKWLICAQRPLQCQELIAAVSVDAQGKCLRLTNDKLLDTCCNLVVLDSELDIFRFAHLSVREYLESREDFDFLNTHILALERCLDIHTFGLTVTTSTEPTVQQNGIFRRYANLYWPAHCKSVESNQLTWVGPLREKLRRFLFRGCDASEQFIQWVSASVGSSESLLWNDPLKDMIKAVASPSPTPLFLACSFGLVSIMDDLGVCVDVNWDQRNGKGHTGLQLAAAGGHDAVVKFLLEKGADIAAKTARGEIALHSAAGNGHETVVQLLLEKDGSLIEAKNARGEAALHKAVGNAHKTVVMVLLDKGANIMAKDDRKKTPLHWSARRGDEAVVHLLLEKGAEVAAIDAGESTALHLAAGCGYETVVQLLLEKGTDVTGKDADRATALHWAAGRGHETVLRLLLKNGADIAAKDIEGGTALHAAAGRGQDMVVRLLLENGADIASKNIHGETALQRAVRRDREAVVQQLLEHCREHGIAIRDEDMDVTSKELVNPRSHLFCDNCDTRILDPEPHFHCNICDNDDFDLCQNCVSSGISCRDDGHHLIKRQIMYGKCIDLVADDLGMEK